MRLILVFLVALGVTGCTTQPLGEPTHGQTSARLRTELAAEYYARAQFGVALDELRKALLADAGYAPAYDVRALVHMALREDKEAEEDFTTSLRLDNLSSETHNNYGWFLCQRGRERDSVKQFLAALKNPLYTTPEKAFLNAGICSRKAGEVNDAEEFLKKALLVHPEMPEALSELAELYFAKGDYVVAKSAFTSFLRAAGDNVTAGDLWLGIRIERKLGDKNAQESYSVQLHNRFPDSHEYQLMLNEQ
jgi:type IV pilus assembly protein PilF